MAVQFLGSVAGSSIDGSDVTINLDSTLVTTGGGLGHAAGTAYQSNDWCIIVTTSLTGGYIPSKQDDHGVNWNEFNEHFNTPVVTTNNAIKLHHRFLGNATDTQAQWAGRGPSVTIVGTGNSAYGLAVLALVFRTVSDTSLIFGGTPDQYIGAVGNQSSTNPDPPALPSGTTSADCFMLAIYFSETVDTTVTTPTGYTLTARSSANAAIAAQVGAAWRQLSGVSAVAPQDPPPFTGYSTSNWAAVTIPLDAGIVTHSVSVAETVATSTVQTGDVIKPIGESAAISDVVTAVKVNNNGRVFGGAYAVDFALTGWSGRTLRQVLTPAALAQVPPGPMGARFEFAAGTSTTIGPAYIGVAAAAGDSYDFDGNQVQLTFDGGSATKVVSGAASIDTDQVMLANYDPNKSLIVSLYMGAGTVNPKGYGF
jgi:hypothetical protein